jgi:hypothetical protein
MTGSPPTPVTCPHYAPPPGERPCRHYLPNGACDRPDEFLCVEWLKRNGLRASVGANEPTANDVVASDVDAASPTTGGFSPRWRSLFDHAPPRLAPPRRLARARPTAPVSTTTPPLAPPPALLASAEDVTALAERYAETQLATDTLGPVWLVAEPTGSVRPAGRPKTRAALDRASFQQMVDALGGVRPTARAVGCAASTIVRYLSGERAVPGEVVARCQRALTTT